MFSNSSKANPIVISLSLAAWVIAGFFVAQMSIVFFWRLFVGVSGYTQPPEADPLTPLILSAIAYVVALLMIVGLPRAVFPEYVENLKTLFGLTRRPKALSGLYALLGYGTYFVLTLCVMGIVQAIWKDFPINETQQVGFGNLSSTGDYVMAYIALAIIPPFAEEALFRGYLFGQLRRKSRLVPSMLVTSVVFGLVHWQWNVSVDVFVLSLVLCYLREYTGTIWAGIILHIIKNSIAFVMLFLQPQVLQAVLKLFSH